jgi:chemotaxis signal transduction protein
MKSFVIFQVMDQFFGIDIENVKRILPSPTLTAMPDEGAHIEGMFQYEDEVIKVLSFRKVIDKKSYEEELKEMFPRLISEHKAWLDALVHSVEENAPFEMSTDPHTCHLGKWISSFHPEEDAVINVMKHLDFHHQRLHRSAVDVLEYKNEDPLEAKQWIEENVHEIYEKTLKYLDEISNMSDKVASTMQRCLILFDKKKGSFGVNIDTVEDILHIEESELHKVKDVQHMGAFMDVSAILEHNGKLITIVKDISINQRSA